MDTGGGLASGLTAGAAGGSRFPTAPGPSTRMHGMTLQRKWLKLFFEIATFGTLTVDYVIGGYWLVCILIAAILIAGRLTKRMQPSWLPTASFTFNIILAAAGILLKLSPMWMIPTVTFALGAWDLDRLQRTRLEGSPEAIKQAETSHLVNLMTSLAIGLLLALGGRMIHIRLPFGVAAGLVVLLFAGLDQLVKRSAPAPR
jgi:hypothetical protein